MELILKNLRLLTKTRIKNTCFNTWMRMAEIEPARS